MLFTDDMRLSAGIYDSTSKSSVHGANSLVVRQGIHNGKSCPVFELTGYCFAPL
jgi:hypothetical protein